MNVSLIVQERCLVAASGYSRMNPISSTQCGKLILKIQKGQKVLPDNFLSSFLGHHSHCCLCHFCKESSCKVKLILRPASLCGSAFLPFYGRGMSRPPHVEGTPACLWLLTQLLKSFLCQTFGWRVRVFMRVCVCVHITLPSASRQGSSAHKSERSIFLPGCTHL